ncbi:MAG: hypothetical protein LBK95_14925 [Bifidobacteriaceae bacterium]|jgi:hypothetical protein|nr:hypothetical protein [Bifidobacteriaceae bacterium]
MRTTVTLTPEAESLVQAAMAKHGWSFSQAVNAAVTRGLAPGPRQRFDTPTRPIGLRPIPGHRALALESDLEDEALIAEWHQSKRSSRTPTS